MERSWHGGIEWTFHRLDRADLERAPLSPGEVPALRRCLSWGPSSPLLGAPRVRRALAAAVRSAGSSGTGAGDRSGPGTQARLIAVECRPNAVTVLDYGTSRGDVFFAETGETGEYAACVEKPIRGAAGNGIRAGLRGTSGNVPMEERVPGAGLVTPFLPAHGAFLVHAAAVAAAGKGAGSAEKAALFLARDEGGKTTAARLAAGSANYSAGGPVRTRAVIIGDDQILLRRGRGRYWVYGTPWNLISSGPVGAPLGGIFLLEKGRHFRLVPLKAYDATAFIWDEHRHVTDFMPAAVRKKAFDLVAGACASVPVYRLTFTKDRLDWPAVLACLK